VLAALLASACPDRLDLDLVAPTVHDISPLPGTVVPVDTSFTVTFSEPMARDSIDQEEGLAVALAPSTIFDDGFLSDIATLPLSQTRAERVVPLEMELSADFTELTVTPTTALAPDTVYFLVLSADIRDPAGNPLVWTDGLAASVWARFTTDDGPPTYIADDLFAAGGVVAPNRRRITVWFDQPVVGLGVDTVAIDAVGGATPATTQSLLIAADRSSATLLLASGAGCETLSPAADYELRVGPGLTDDEGETMEVVRTPFTTSAACDLEPNVVASVEAIAGEVDAHVRFDTTKASTTEARWGLVGGELDCLGTTPCPARAADAVDSLPGVSPPLFRHTVNLEGLSLGEQYRVLVLAEDLNGKVAQAETTFTTAVLPKVALNEIHANPNTDQGGEPAGEYVELHNYGDESVSLVGWALEVDGGDEGEGKTCVFGADAPTLAAGAYVVVVGADFPQDFWGLSAAQVFRQALSSSCEQLPNSRSVPMAILDDAGRPVSTFAGYAALEPDQDGRSVERVAPDAPDDESSFCYSHPDVGPTPGAQNAVAEGCVE
jgi:hypothetical protein